MHLRTMCLTYVFYARSTKIKLRWGNTNLIPHDNLARALAPIHTGIILCVNRLFLQSLTAVTPPLTMASCPQYSTYSCKSETCTHEEIETPKCMFIAV